MFREGQYNQKGSNQIPKKHSKLLCYTRFKKLPISEFVEYPAKVSNFHRYLITTKLTVIQNTFDSSQKNRLHSSYPEK